MFLFLNITVSAFKYYLVGLQTVLKVNLYMVCIQLVG